MNTVSSPNTLLQRVGLNRLSSPEDMMQHLDALWNLLPKPDEMNKTPGMTPSDFSREYWRTQHTPRLILDSDLTFNSGDIEDFRAVVKDLIKQKDTSEYGLVITHGGEEYDEHQPLGIMLKKQHNDHWSAQPAPEKLGTLWVEAKNILIRIDTKDSKPGKRVAVPLTELQKPENTDIINDINSLAQPGYFTGDLLKAA